MATLDIRIDSVPWPAEDEPASTRQNPLKKMLSPLTRGSEMKVPEGYSVSDYKVFAILREVLQPKLSNNFDAVSNASHRIVDVFRNPEYQIRSLNALFFDIAEKIPYNHPSQIRLASVLWGIGVNEERKVLARSRVRIIVIEISLVNPIYTGLKTRLCSTNISGKI